MAATVQARLDDKSEAALNRLMVRNGATASQVIRESLIRSDELTLENTPPKMIGVGCFESGISDLGHNKKYLQDLGVKSMGKRWTRPGK